MKKLTIFTITLIVVITSFSNNVIFSRTVRKKTTNGKFFFQDKKLNIVNDLKESEIKKLNKRITHFVLQSTDSKEIFKISSPTPTPGNTSIIANYKFNILTDKGKFVFHVKKVPELEGKKFEKASKKNIAPEGKYLSSGYLISKHFKGKELGKILRQHQELLFENNNYKWIFKKLGKKIATLKNEYIFFRDIIHFNTLVNLDQKELVIIDYQTMGGMSPEKQVRYLIKGLEMEEAFKKEILSLFNKYYESERKK